MATNTIPTAIIVICNNGDTTIANLNRRPQIPQNRVDFHYENRRFTHQSTALGDSHHHHHQIVQYNEQWVHYESFFNDSTTKSTHNQHRFLAFEYNFIQFLRSNPHFSSINSGENPTPNNKFTYNFGDCTQVIYLLHPSVSNTSQLSRAIPSISMSKWTAVDKWQVRHRNHLPEHTLGLEPTSNYNPRINIPRNDRISTILNMNWQPMPREWILKHSAHLENRSAIAKHNKSVISNSQLIKNDFDASKPTALIPHIAPTHAIHTQSELE